MVNHGHGGSRTVRFRLSRHSDIDKFLEMQDNQSATIKLALTKLIEETGMRNVKVSEAEKSAFRRSYKLNWSDEDKRTWIKLTKKTKRDSEDDR